MKKKRVLSFIVTIAMALSMLPVTPSTVWAEDTYSISGKITGSDEPGGIPASLTLKDSSGTELSTTTAIADGTYTFSGVAAGTGYTIDISCAGYRSGTITAFDVTGSDVTGKDLELPVASTDADLSSLVLSTGTLSPDFDKDTVAYTASVASTVSSITLMHTVDDVGGASAKIDGIPVSSGTTSGSISLAEGSNIIEVIVTAEDRMTTKTYTITVTRADATGEGDNITTDEGYLTDENGIMAYQFVTGYYAIESAVVPSKALDIHGFYDGEWRQTTYDNGGYLTYIKVDGGSAVGVTASATTAATVDGLAVRVIPTFVNSGKQIKITYEVKNTSGGQKTFSLGTVADAEVDEDDKAAISEIDPTAAKGLKMTASSGAQFNLFGKGYDNVTDVDQYWYGEFGDDPDAAAFFEYDEESTEESYDSAIAYSWNGETIAAGADASYSVLIGIGGEGSENLNPSETPAINPDLSTTGATYNQNAAAAALSIGASVTDGGTLTYQWYKNNANSYAGATAIAGAESASYTPGTGTVGTAYYFCVVTNTLDGTPPKTAAARSAIAKITVVASSSPDNGGSSSSGRKDSSDSVSITIDGKEYDIASESRSGTKTTLTVKQKEFADSIDRAAPKSSVTLPVGENTTAEASLNLKHVGDMADKNMSLVVKTGGVSYNLPASSLDTDAVKSALGTEDGSRVKFVVSIKKTTANVPGAEVIGTPVEFTITASYGGKTVKLDTFTEFVSREIEITAEQAAKITTAVVYETDGTVRHIPTYVYQKGGKWYARINSLTNSTYVLIWNEQSFADASGKWYQDVVGEMASRKVVNGVTATSFAGDKSITRAEFAAIIVRALGLPANGASTFSDVASKAWYSAAVDTAAKYGIVTGVGGNEFKPAASITREEAMAMLYRASALTGYKTVGGDKSGEFSDYGTQSGWATQALNFNLNNGFIVGTDGKINPKKNISRAEVAAVILRMLQKSELVDVRAKV